eukprot:CAMPEP_0115080448 /NCGR_PEP_ID=MMETSP0227-20121206/18682_1 /TAXON_ID=89957 /ORGANISM="Polarella glacialis, Strain CCMP 1383" /LENGTH=623 /DNA_ID=CAMNT_0002468089 /DNA_START=177 /DNA_END=2048 /DNA_ORIENTATION=+
MIDKVQAELEQLFSKENLQQDSFIQQHMTAQLWIPLCLLGGHHQIEAIGPVNIDTLLEASKKSEKIGVDEENMLIRPLIKSRRNTLILRELPEGITEEELKEVFATFAEVRELLSVKPDVNSTAFVTFDTDEAAQNAALWLRSQKLRGEAVRCSMKSEQFMRSFFPMPGSAARAPEFGMPSYQAMYGGMTPMSNWAQQWVGGQDMWGGGYQPDAGKGGGCGGKDGKGKGSFEKGKEKGSFDKGYEKGGEKGSFDKGYEKGWDKGKGKGKGKGKRKGVGMGGSPMLGPSHAMHGIDRELEAMQQQAYAQAALDGNDMGEGEVDFDENLGYKHEFRRYSRQQIIETCSGMADVEKPESYTKMELKYPDLALFRQSPNKDWAPLPTPMTSFASSFLGADRRGSTGGVDDSADWDGDRGRGRKERSNTWASSGTGQGRGSRSMSADLKEDSNAAEGGDWDAPWDASAWPKGGGASWRGSKRWGWDEWNGAGSGALQWVPKSPEDAEGGDAPPKEDAESKDTKEAIIKEDESNKAAKRPSWVEKVRGGGEKGAPPQRWKAKPKSGENEDSSSPALPQKAEVKSSPPPPQKAEAGPKSGEAQAMPEKEVSSGENKPLTWADKARAAASK